MEPEVHFLTVKEVSDALGISPNGVRDRIRRGLLPAVKSGRAYLVAAADLLESQGVSKGVARYLCQFLAVSLAQNLAKVFEEKARLIVEERLDLALAREAELNREVGELRERARLAMAWAERAQQELDAFRILHGIDLKPGTKIRLDSGRLKIEGEAPGQ